jgi:hypothetical protein
VKRAVPALVILLACTSNSDLGGGDQDGIVGGDFTFIVKADESAFSPAVLKVQNSANVTVTLQSVGTKPHGFRIDSIDAATIAPVAPGASATVKFMSPAREAIYAITSSASGDALQGQLVVQ